MENLNEKNIIEEFEEKIDYKFKDAELLKQALSHSSYINEHHRQGKCNERLEFLGDSVLSIVVSEFLFHKFPDIPEGKLSKLRASLVCEKALFSFSHKIDLGEYIFLGHGEEISGGRERPSIVSDAFEAVIAAIFLDGGMETAKKYVLSFMPENLDPDNPLLFKDYKTILQEIIQRNPEEKMEYVVVGQTGPAHERKFVVDIYLNSNVLTKGEGTSKKSAEQEAAKQALILMGYEV